jgi:hypothetical protein
MLGRFFTLWPRYRSDAWLRSIIAEKAQGDDPLT